MNPSFVEYVNKDNNVVVLVPLSTVQIEAPFPQWDVQLPLAIAQTLIAPILKAENIIIPPEKYSAMIERWPLARQPWPIFICEEFNSGDIIAEYYPRVFTSQIIANTTITE